MTFTVTPQPFNVPPRVRIDVSSDDVSKPFTSLKVMRDGKLLREQPFVGSSTVVMFDYEAPFGSTVTYSASGTIANTTTLRDETWANLSGWSTVSGSPSVAGGHFGGGEVNRPVAFPASGRLVSQGLPIGSPGISSLRFGPLLVLNSANSGGQFNFGDGAITMGVGGLGSPFTVTWSPDKATLITAAGTWVIQRTAGVPSNLITATTVVAGSFVQPFVVYSLLDAPFSATASAYLDVRETWLIHPSKPGLSVPIYNHESSDGLRWIEASSGDQKSSGAVSTIHRPVGRRKAVVITSGPRQADEWTLVVESLTIGSKNSLRAIVDDQTPLLLRSPADVVMDLPDDWYAVGDVSVSRVEVPVITEATLTSMPLIPVDEPVVRVGALWTAGDVLLRYATGQAVLDAFDTALDLLAGPDY